ncbi:MAG: MarR family transcriptional regulator [Gammaproteobacteria bacterium]|nr:MAG: MarR family transcriptional regulator [Gammaproteobacteria bacterium]
MESLRLDNQLCFLLYAASRRMTQLYRPLLDELGLTYPQYLVMLVLWEDERGEGVPVSHVCSRLKLDTGTVTPLLKRLEEHGQVARRRSSGDERVVRVYLTEAGRALEAQAADVPAQLLCQTRSEPERILHWRSELQALLRQLEAASG